jgi:hypothetical protein
VETAPDPGVLDFGSQRIGAVEVALGVEVAGRSRRVEAVDVEVDGSTCTAGR